MDKEVRLPYGSTMIQITIPKENIAFILEPAQYPQVTDVAKEIHRSLAQPIASQPIRELAKKSKRVVILADDLTRITPVKQILPPLIAELHEAGLHNDNMKIIIALGTHRRMTNGEIESKFGGDVQDSIRIENHDCHAKENLVQVQDSRSRYPIWINREFAESDLKIGLGNVQPHDCAGWSGGSKILLPGIAGEETTDLMHLIAGYIPPEKRLGIPENPVRVEMDSVAKKVGLDLIVNTVLNVQKQIVGLFFGNVVKAHRAAIQRAKPIFCPSIRERADVVVVSSHPADLDYWQAMKGVAAGFQTLKKGGTMILVTPCPEGIAQPHPEFEKSGTLPLNEIKRRIRDKEFKDLAAAGLLMDHARFRARFKLIFVSQGLNDRMCEKLGVERMDTLEEAIAEERQARGGRMRMGFLTHSDLAPNLLSF